MRTQRHRHGCAGGPASHSRVSSEALGVRVTVLGTPAEETGGGKLDLIDAGAFEDSVASMMVHPGPVDVLDPAFQAIVHLSVEYFGKESHAAYAPQLGRNALDAAVQAYMNVSTLRQAMYAGFPPRTSRMCSRSTLRRSWPSNSVRRRRSRREASE